MDSLSQRESLFAQVKEFSSQVASCVVSSLVTLVDLTMPSPLARGGRGGPKTCSGCSTRFTPDDKFRVFNGQG
jgi:hypothetical protein